MRTKKRSEKKKDRITVNKFDLAELAKLSAEHSDLKPAADLFLFRQKRGTPEDMRLISNVFRAYGPVCDIVGNSYGLISTGQLLLCYVWLNESLQNQFLEQQAKRHGAALDQGQRFE